MILQKFRAKISSAKQLLNNFSLCVRKKKQCAIVDFCVQPPQESHDKKLQNMSALVPLCDLLLQYSVQLTADHGGSSCSHFLPVHSKVRFLPAAPRAGPAPSPCRHPGQQYDLPSPPRSCFWISAARCSRWSGSAAPG